MRIGHRVETMTNSELEEELKMNQSLIESLIDTNRIIENELFYRNEQKELFLFLNNRLDEYGYSIGIDSIDYEEYLSMNEMMSKYNLSINDYDELIECGYSNISGKSIVYPKSEELYKGWVEEKFVTELKEAIRKYNISKL